MCEIATSPAGGAPHGVFMGSQPVCEPSPFFPVLDQVNRCPVHSKAFSDLFLRPAVDERCENLSLCQLCKPIPFAFDFKSAMATFFDCIALVLLPRSQPKMCRVHARRVIAGVADLKLWMNWPLVMLVEISRGHNESGPTRDGSVSTMIKGSGPAPAAIGLDLESTQMIHSVSHAAIVWRIGSHLNRQEA